MPYAFCYVLINCFVFFNLFVSFMFSCFVCFALYFVSSVLLYYFFIASSHVYNCVFSICVHFYRPLPPARNPAGVNKYLMIYHYITHARCESVFPMSAFLFKYAVNTEMDFSLRAASTSRLLTVRN